MDFPRKNGFPQKNIEFSEEKKDLPRAKFIFRDKLDSFGGKNGFSKKKKCIFREKLDFMREKRFPKKKKKLTEEETKMVSPREKINFSPKNLQH